jgi:hypothetical protein
MLAGVRECILRQAQASAKACCGRRRPAQKHFAAGLFARLQAPGCPPMLAGVRECILRQAQASAKAFCGRRRPAQKHLR